MAPILGIWASSALPAANAGSFQSIATVTVGSGGSSSVTFSSIPGTYTHLQIRGIGRSSRNLANDNLALQFNSDTGSNYTMHLLIGDGSSASAQGYSSQTYANCFDALPAATASANIFGTAVIDILDYTSTNKYKTVRLLGGQDRNGAGTISFNSSLWLSTNAITSIKIYAATGPDLVQYSSFALYGIKGS